jgi:trehalose 6-phosphate phosphatase
MKNDADLKIDLASSALFFDIDGTLLDLAPTPDLVVVPAGLPQMLETLSSATQGATAFLTGRSIAAVDALFAPLRLPAVGGHGAEFRLASDAEVESAAPLPVSLRHGLKELERVAPGIIVEDKVSTLSLHYRLAPEAGPILKRALDEQRAQLNASGLQLLLGKEIIEIKPRLFNKGTGLLRMLHSEAFKGRTPVFFGDDTTDEDAFRVLAELGGIGISVGRPIEGASHMFKTPTQLRAFLKGVAHINGSGG